MKEITLKLQAASVSSDFLFEHYTECHQEGVSEKEESEGGQSLCRMHVIIFKGLLMEMAKEILEGPYWSRKFRAFIEDFTIVHSCSILLNHTTLEIPLCLLSK